MNSLYLFNEENILKQIAASDYRLGFYKLTFYSEKGKPSEVHTGHTDTFYLYPSGGTLRDKDLNIVFYSSRFDTYRGFVPPGKS